MATIQENPEVEKRRRRRMERMRARRKSVSGTYPRSYIECLERKNQELAQEIKKASRYFLDDLELRLFHPCQEWSARLLAHHQVEPRIREIEFRIIPKKEDNSNHSDYKLSISVHPRALDYAYDRAIPLHIGRTSTCGENEEREMFGHLQQHFAPLSRQIGMTDYAAAWGLDGVKLTSPSIIGYHRRQGLFGLGPDTYQQLYYYTKTLDPISYPNASESIVAVLQSSIQRDSADDVCRRLLSSILGGKVEEELQYSTNERLEPGHYHGISPSRSPLSYGVEDNAFSKESQGKGTSLSMSNRLNKKELSSNSLRERGLRRFNCVRKPSLVLGSSLLAYGLPLAAAAFNHWDALRVTSGVASMGTGVAVMPLQQVEGVPEKAWLWTSLAWAGCFMPYLWLKTREIPKQFVYRRKFYIFSVILASVHFIIGMSQGLEGAGSGFALYGPIVLTTCAYLVSLVFVPHGASDRDIVATGLEYLGVSPSTSRALNLVLTPISAPAER